jgi:hypothetical protein
MRQRLMSVCLSMFAIIVFASLTAGTGRQEPQRPTQDLPVREELNRKFQFTRFGQVEVSGVAGDVSIETHEGNIVNVFVMRSAETQSELDCYQTVIENTPDRLTIRHQQMGQGKCTSIRARQRVRLRVPRGVDVSLETIAGAVDVGRIDGALRLQGIAGHATASGVREAEIDGLAQGLTMSIAQPTAEGIRVTGVSGQVDLNVSSDVNADLKVSGLINVDPKTTGVTMIIVHETNGTRRFGTGGPPITISGIVGGVRINR